MSEVQSFVERLLHCTLELGLPATSFKSVFLTLSLPLQPLLWLIAHSPTAVGRTLRAAGTTSHEPGWRLRDSATVLFATPSVRART